MEISVDMSASFFWTSWLAARGLPNCFLSRVYCARGGGGGERSEREKGARRSSRPKEDRRYEVVASLPPSLTSLALTMQSSAAPRLPHAIPYLALLRHPKGPPKPVTCGRTFPAGTRTSSMNIIPVSEARSENLPSILGASRPGVPFSTTNPRTRPSSSRAQITNTSAIGEFVIQFLVSEGVRSDKQGKGILATSTCLRFLFLFPSHACLPPLPLAHL